MATLRKLTLSIDEGVIQLAHRYSREHNVSISRLVTNYLAGLADSESDPRVSKTVRRLRGILPPDVTLDEYRQHLEKKYAR